MSIYVAFLVGHMGSRSQVVSSPNPSIDQTALAAELYIVRRMQECSI